MSLRSSTLVPLSVLSLALSAFLLYRRKRPFVTPSHSDCTALLPQGATNYYFVGPEDGTRIVFVHGIISPARSVSKFIQCLANSGFRVLCYDLYGRGHSENPDANHDNALLVSQLANLLQYLNWTRVNLIGYSLGGAIAAGFASKFKRLVNSITFIAPAGIMKTESPLVTMVRIPIIGSIYFHTLGVHIIRYQKISDDLKRGIDFPEWINYCNYQKRHFETNFNLPSAFKSTLLHFDVSNLTDLFSKVGKSHSYRILCIWGDNDNTVPTNLAVELMHLIPSIRLAIKESTTHAILIEYPEYVASVISEFVDGL
ncbi:Alpha/Beta hydrolase protein [Globomyces pollinis-pini]|nr:Alpha/Beta hydrolase protein [Globomyces pollinis-pini]